MDYFFADLISNDNLIHESHKILNTYLMLENKYC